MTVLSMLKIFSAISSIQWIGWQSNYRNAIDYMASVDKYRLGMFYHFYAFQEGDF